MLKFSVQSLQKVKAEIAKKLKSRVHSEYVTVGIHEDAGMHSGGITNAQLGAALHFGTGDIPARQWLDVGVNESAKEYTALINDGLASGADMQSILDQVGVVAVASVQTYMTQLKTPPNAEATIKQKGSSNPLIDEGQLRQSVSYKHATTKPEEGI